MFLPWFYYCYLISEWNIMKYNAIILAERLKYLMCVAIYDIRVCLWYPIYLKLSVILSQEIPRARRKKKRNCQLRSKDKKICKIGKSRKDAVTSARNMTTVPSRNHVHSNGKLLRNQFFIILLEIHWLSWIHIAWFDVPTMTKATA